MKVCIKEEGGFPFQSLNDIPEVWIMYKTYEDYYFDKLKNQTYDDMLTEAIKELKNE